MTLYLVGDSHTKAMRLAYADAPDAFETPREGLVIGLNLCPHPRTLKPFFSTSEAEISFTDDLIPKRLKNITGARSFQAGDENHYLVCMPYTTTVWLRLDQWRRFRPWRTCQDEHQPLSDLVVRELALAHFRYLIEFVHALRELKLNFAIIEAPPPRSDETAANVGEQTLLELNRLAREAINAALQDFPVIRPVAGAYDELGFLRHCYREPIDQHHANQDYGAVMLTEVLRRSRELFPELGWPSSDLHRRQASGAV